MGNTDWGKILAFGIGGLIGLSALSRLMESQNVIIRTLGAVGRAGGGEGPDVINIMPERPAMPDFGPIIEAIKGRDYRVLPEAPNVINIIPGGEGGPPDIRDLVPEPPSFKPDWGLPDLTPDLPGFFPPGPANPEGGQYVPDRWSELIRTAGDAAMQVGIAVGAPIVAATAGYVAYRGTKAVAPLLEGSARGIGSFIQKAANKPAMRATGEVIERTLTRVTPRVLKRAAPRIGGRLLGRLIPGIGWGVLAADVGADIARMFGADVPEWLGFSGIVSAITGENPLEARFLHDAGTTGHERERAVEQVQTPTAPQGRPPYSPVRIPLEKPVQVDETEFKIWGAGPGGELVISKRPPETYEPWEWY